MLPIFGAVLAILMVVFAAPILRLVNTPADVFQSTKAYFAICGVGLFFTGWFCAIAAVLRGMGDSKGPTVFIGFSTVFNIFGDIMCVKTFGMGAAGAALATTAAQGLSVLTGLFYLKRHHFPFDFRPRSFRISPEHFRILMRLGIPTAAQEALTSVSFVVMEGIINNIGSTASAAAGVGDRLFNVAIIPALAFSAAIAAMVAQNTGANKPERSHKCLMIGASFSVAVGLIIFAVMAFLPEQCIRLFTEDVAVIGHGVDYMAFYKYDMLLCTAIFCVNGYINGIGRARFTMICNLISSIGVRLPVVWLISRVPGVTLYHIGFGMPAASVIQIFIVFGFLLFAKREREYRKNKHLQKNIM